MFLKKEAFHSPHANYQKLEELKALEICTHIHHATGRLNHDFQQTLSVAQDAQTSSRTLFKILMGLMLVMLHILSIDSLVR